MGRAPCCDKANVKKGPWSPEEDHKLKTYIEQHGTGGNWIALPQKIGLKRCGKSCRLRWLNYLRPNIKHGGFTEEEDNIICSLYISIGSRWSIIAAQLPGRTDNDIKNYWNTKLKKKLLGKQRKEQQARRINCMKQEMKKVNGDCMVAMTNNVSQNPYLPEPPIPISMPYPNQNSSSYDHLSIRKLLIKLGGRFSNDHQQPNDNGMSRQCPTDFDVSSTQQQFYENSLSPLASMNSLNNNCSKFPNEQCNNVEGVNIDMLQGLESFTYDFDEIVYSNPHKLEGLECLYGVEDMIKGSTTGTNSAETTSWVDMGSSVYPPISNYSGFQQGVLHESDFVESAYFGSQ